MSDEAMTSISGRVGSTLQTTQGLMFVSRLDLTFLRRTRTLAPARLTW